MKQKTTIGTVITGVAVVTTFLITDYPRAGIMYRAQTQFKSFAIKDIFELDTIELDLLTNSLGVTFIPSVVFGDFMPKDNSKSFTIEIENSAAQTPDIYYSLLNFD